MLSRLSCLGLKVQSKGIGLLNVDGERVSPSQSNRSIPNEVQVGMVFSSEGATWRSSDLESPHYGSSGKPNAPEGQIIARTPPPPESEDVFSWVQGDCLFAVESLGDEYSWCVI